VGIPKRLNAQALALFLIGYCKLYLKAANDEYLASIHWLAEALRDECIPGYSGACWGYPFDWQARSFYLPEGTPLIIPTAYATEALYAAHKITNNNEDLDMAISASEFVRHDLNRIGTDSGFTFSYSPLDHSVVYNASLMGTKILAQAYHATNEHALLHEASQSVYQVIRRQREDGSWTYGEADHHQWIDNFHTGYNLQCLSDYQQLTKDDSVQEHIEEGFVYYLGHFFHQDGRPKYFDDKTYPIDVNNTAQLVLTLDALNKWNDNKELLYRILDYTINQMQSGQGWFYYQRNKFYTNKIPYLRWTQAWMFNALATFLTHE